jgi:hypothetical protein
LLLCLLSANGLPTGGLKKRVPLFVCARVCTCANVLTKRFLTILQANTPQDWVATGIFGHFQRAIASKLSLAPMSILQCRRPPSTRHSRVVLYSFTSSTNPENPRPLYRSPFSSFCASLLESTDQACQITICFFITEHLLVTLISIFPLLSPFP